MLKIGSISSISNNNVFIKSHDSSNISESVKATISAKGVTSDHYSFIILKNIESGKNEPGRPSVAAGCIRIATYLDS